MNTLLCLLLIIAARWAWLRYISDASTDAHFSAGKHWALALAQPMADARGPTHFLDRDASSMQPEGRAFYRGPMLYQFGCRLDASDDQVRQHLAQTLESSWQRLDLQDLRETDDPRAALAFACVRVAHLVRTAMLMDWVQTDSAWRVLLLNAQRARECFDSWEDLGRAYATGRAQWVAALHADPLGAPFDETQLNTLLDRRKGVWGPLPWPGPVLGLP